MIKAGLNQSGQNMIPHHEGSAYNLAPGGFMTNQVLLGQIANKTGVNWFSKGVNADSMTNVIAFGATTIATTDTKMSASYGNHFYRQKN